MRESSDQQGSFLGVDDGGRDYHHQVDRGKVRLLLPLRPAGGGAQESVQDQELLQQGVQEGGRAGAQGLLQGGQCGQEETEEAGFQFGGKWIK